MKKILKTLFLLCIPAASFAQQNDPVNLQEIDKPSAPKVVDPKPPAVFISVEQMPEYPGGYKALMHFLNRNVHYPDQAKKKNVQGMVIVTFVVDEDGSIVDEKVAKSVGEGLDEEAVRVIKAMPKWKPGTNKGQAVKVQYTLPIRFALGR